MDTLFWQTIQFSGVLNLCARSLGHTTGKIPVFLYVGSGAFLASKCHIMLIFRFILLFWGSSRTGSHTLIFTKHIFPTWCIAAAFLFTLAVCQSRGCILQRPHLKANYVTMPREGCSNPRAPPNAAHNCGLLFPLFGGCMATILHGLTYPKILCAPEKKKKERQKMATSRGVDHYFRGPGRRKSGRKGKTSGMLVCPI